MKIKSLSLNLLCFSVCSIPLHAHQDTEGETLIELPAYTIKGERTDRSLRETASSVSLVDEKMLEDSDLLVSRDDLLDSIANMVSAGNTNLAPAVRGVDGTGPAQGATAFFAGTRSRLAMIVDNRPAGFNELVFGDNSLWDVEQVEVYRGPQSTLNGRNAIAGAIVINTKDPTFYQEGAIRVSVGNYENRQYAVMYSAPLSESWAFRIAGEHNTRESYLDLVEYDSGEEDPKEFESNSLRFKLLYQPQYIDGFKSLTTFTYYDYQGPQGEQVVYPFEDEVPQVAQTAIFNPDGKSVSNETTFILNDSYTLENTFVYSDNHVDRFVNVSGTGMVEIDNTDILIEPRLRYTGSESFTGFIGVHYFDEDQDEFIDIRNSSYDDSTTTMAVFGEATYDITESLELIVGGRWEEEQRERVGGLVAPFAVNLDETYTSFLPKVSLNKRLSDRWSVGVLVSKGFNGGGAGVTFAAPFTSYEYEEESVWNYEIFTRAELLDGKLVLNANLFFDDYKDMQLPYLLASNSAVIRNADKAETYGAEVGARWFPVAGLTIHADLGLLKTEVTKYEGSDYEGNELARSPSFTGTFGFNYKHKSGFDFGANARYSSSYYSNIDNTLFTKVDSYFVMGAQAGYSLGSVRIFTYVKNLLDDNSVVYYPSSGSDITSSTATLLNPRTWGVGLEYHF